MTSTESIFSNNVPIAYILNEYIKDLGNSTKIVYIDGRSYIINKSVASVLNIIAEHYSLDLKLIRKKQQVFINSKYYVPLPISHNLLLIPIKTRKPIVCKDPTLSYINYYCVEKIDKYKPVIHLKNGEQLYCLNSIKTLNKRFKDGKVCHKLGENFYEQFSPSSLAAATKGDLQKLKTELVEAHMRLLTDLLKEEKK